MSFGWKNNAKLKPEISSNRMGWRGSKTFPVAHFAQGGIAGESGQTGNFEGQWPPGGDNQIGTGGEFENQIMPLPNQNQMGEIGQNSGVWDDALGTKGWDTGIIGTPGAGTSGGLMTPGSNPVNPPPIISTPGAGTSGGLMTPGTPPTLTNTFGNLPAGYSNWAQYFAANPGTTLRPPSGPLSGRQGWYGLSFGQQPLPPSQSRKRWPPIHPFTG